MLIISITIYAVYVVYTLYFVEIHVAIEVHAKNILIKYTAEGEL